MSNALVQRLKRRVANLLTTVSSGGRGIYNGTNGWFNIIREGFSGAWQSNVVLDTYGVTAFSAVFACATGTANDIAKLRIKLMALGEKGVGKELPLTKRFSVLRKPNDYQNRKQFVEHWQLSKLLWGNAYILKVRDGSGTVVALYILDPQRVTVLVSEGGDVYYRLGQDYLSDVKTPVTVPAANIIHDRMNCLFHPLVGVSPIYACGMSATMGTKIQKNSSGFFNNMSRPSGLLTTVGTISDETAEQMKKQWEENFSGEKIGRLAVLGDGLKYEPMTIPANDAQLIEQLKWTVEDVARAFHYPLYKLGGTVPSHTSVGALNQAYYSDCLQPLIEDVELCLDDGLALPENCYTELDLKALLRMDAAARFESKGKAVKDGWMTPNEARADEDLEAVAGGDSCYLQQQNFSLDALSKRDAKDDPFASARSPSAPPPQSSASEDEALEVLREFSDKLVRGLEVTSV